MRCLQVLSIVAVFGALAVSPAYAGAEDVTFYEDVLPIL